MDSLTIANTIAIVNVISHSKKYQISHFFHLHLLRHHCLTFSLRMPHFGDLSSTRDSHHVPNTLKTSDIDNNLCTAVCLTITS